jgi:hypothetical protein
MPTTYVDATPSANLITSLGATPVSGDSVIVSQPRVRYTAGMDLSNGGTVDLLSVVIPRSRLEGVGDQGTRLKVECDRTNTGTFVNKVGAAVPVMVTGVSITDEIHTVINDGLPGSALDIESALVKFWYNQGAYGVVRGTCDLEVCHAQGGSMTIYEAESGAGAVDLLIVAGGTVEIRRDCTDTIMGSGTLIVNDATYTPAAVTNALIYGGLITLKETASALAFTVWGGATIDCTQIRNPVAITCTTHGAPIILISNSNPMAVTVTETKANNSPGLVYKYID